MALTLIKEPIVAINSTPNYSTFNSVNRRIEFKFLRKDFVKTTNFTIVNSGGYVGFDLTAATAAKEGDLIYFFSGGTSYATGSYEVLLVDTINHIIRINLPYVDSGHANDFINVNADRPNYYLELRVGVNGVNYYQKATPDATGLIIIDISGLLRRLFALKDDFDYFYSNFFGVPEFKNDANQILSFAVRYYERYTGSTDSGVNISRTYYAMNTTPDIDKHSNEFRSYFAAYQQSYLSRWMTMFINPVIFGRLPFDMQMLVEAGGGINKKIQVSYSDRNKIPIYTDFSNPISNAFGTGLKRINAPFYKFIDKWAGEKEGWLLYTIFDFTAGHASEQIYMRYDARCRKNPIYIKWLNKLGGWSYWLFSSNIDYSIDNSVPEIASARISKDNRNSIKEFAIQGQSNEALRLYDDELLLSEKDAWLDFMANENIFMLRPGLQGTFINLDYLKPGIYYTLTIFTKDEHNIEVGDYIQFFGVNTATNLWSYKYQVISVESKKTFTIQSFFAVYVALPSDAIWSKVIDSDDWIMCRKENQQSNIKTQASKFSIAFDLLKPSLTRRIV